MARFTGILGMLVILALAYAFSHRPQSHLKLKNHTLGIRSANCCWGVFRPAFDYWQRGFFAFLGNGANKLLSYSYVGFRVRIR